MIEFTVTPAIASMLAELDGLKEGLGEKGIRAGLVQGAKPLTDTMRSDAPAKFGALRKSIGYRSFTRAERAAVSIAGGTIGLYVGTARKVAESRRRGDGSLTTKKRYQDYKANWIEHGTKPHVIGGRSATKRRRGDKPLRFGGRFVRRVQHPGTKPKPFVGTAITKAGDKMQSRFYDGLINYLERQRARHPAG